MVRKVLKDSADGLDVKLLLASPVARRPAQYHTFEPHFACKAEDRVLHALRCFAEASMCIFCLNQPFILLIGVHQHDLTSTNLWFR